MSSYTLVNKVNVLSSDEQRILKKYPYSTKEEWTKSVYETIKQRIKKELILGQFDRCAYCRKLIEADGKYEPLEHVVAKSLKVDWMFEPKNLIVTCDSCNNLKGDDRTLNSVYDHQKKFPVTSDAFIIFNPHYDTWSEHLAFEDEIFIVPVDNSKGENTIRICKLFRYNIILNRAKELKLDQKSQVKKTLYRLQKADINSKYYAVEKANLIKAMDHFIDRMENDPNFS